jgi:hypothetical protein
MGWRPSHPSRDGCRGRQQSGSVDSTAAATFSGRQSAPDAFRRSLVGVYRRAHARFTPVNVFGGLTSNVEVGSGVAGGRGQMADLHRTAGDHQRCGTLQRQGRWQRSTFATMPLALPLCAAMASTLRIHSRKLSQSGFRRTALPPTNAYCLLAVDTHIRTIQSEERGHRLPKLLQRCFLLCLGEDGRLSLGQLWILGMTI